MAREIRGLYYASEDYTPVYWEFEMRRSPGLAAHYYMALLDDDRGRQIICFASMSATVESGIFHNSPALFELAIPFALFSKAVEKVLTKQDGAEMKDRPVGSYGSFWRGEGDAIMYVTRCGQRYLLRRDVLEDLAS